MEVLKNYCTLIMLGLNQAQNAHFYFAATRFSSEPFMPVSTCNLFQSWLISGFATSYGYRLSV